MTKLSKWYDDENGVYTRDTWTIPEVGTEIWCTGWSRGQTIKPYKDDECHVSVSGSCYHCDQIMGIMKQWEAEGHTWGIQGVEMEREQRINGYWQKVIKQEVAK